MPWTTLSEDRRALIEAGDAAVRWLRSGKFSGAVAGGRHRSQ